MAPVTGPTNAVLVAEVDFSVSIPPVVSVPAVIESKPVRLCMPLLIVAPAALLSWKFDTVPVPDTVWAEEPLRTRFPVPLIVPLFTKVEATLRLFGLEIVTVRPLPMDRVFTENVPLTVGSLVMAPEGMDTSLEDVGTLAGLQLPAVFQLLLVAPVQVDALGVTVTEIELVLRLPQMVLFSKAVCKVANEPPI